MGGVAKQRAGVVGGVEDVEIATGFSFVHVEGYATGQQSAEIKAIIEVVTQGVGLVVEVVVVTVALKLVVGYGLTAAEGYSLTVIINTILLAASLKDRSTWGVLGHLVAVLDVFVGGDVRRGRGVTGAS